MSRRATHPPLIIAGRGLQFPPGLMMTQAVHATARMLRGIPAAVRRRPAAFLVIPAGILALSTGPCSVVGCGAPVLPVVGLVFTGLSSGTLALLSVSSRIAAATVLVLLSVAVLYLGWQTASPSSGETGGSDAAPPGLD